MVLKRYCQLSKDEHRSHFGSRYTLGCCACAGLPLQRWRSNVGLLRPCAKQTSNWLVSLGEPLPSPLPLFQPSSLVPCLALLPSPLSPPAPLFPFISSWRLRRAPRLHQVSRGFEPRSLDSESRVLTVTPRDHLGDYAAWISTGTRMARLVCVRWRPYGGAARGPEEILPAKQR